ncbi:MAG: DNA-binding protein [Bacteroidetes bacterium GWA2_32_17]|nr:MAG: DNA-binding protein [Bacteroidetes bacterium GWA2_32_17]
MKTITFNELRRIKDKLPDGSMQAIADSLNINLDTVRNYFGGTKYDNNEIIGIHTEQGPDGGIVLLDDTTILEEAIKILNENNLN